MAGGNASRSTGIFSTLKMRDFSSSTSTAAWLSAFPVNASSSRRHHSRCRKLGLSTDSKVAVLASRRKILLVKSSLLRISQSRQNRMSEPR